MKLPWRFVFVVLLVLFVSKFILATFCGVRQWPISLLNLGVCLGLVYLSFIVEGIVLAVAKIEDYDDEATVRTFKSKFGPSDVLGPSLVRLKRDSNNILVGQPLLAIAIAFAFNEVLTSSGVPAGAGCTALPSWLEVWMPFYSSEGLSIFITTMLIYWLSQVLPQSLAKTSAAAFMRVPGAMLTARVLAKVAWTGVGEPGSWLVRLVSRAGFDSTEMKLPLGDDKFLEAMSTDYDQVVESRVINITAEANRVMVDDAATHSYLTARKDIDYFIRLARNQFNTDVGVTLQLTLPDGYAREPIRTRQMFSHVFDREIERDKTAEQVGAVLLWGEDIFALRTSSVKDVPWTTLKTSYQLQNSRLDSTPGSDTLLYFSLGVPTKQVEIRIAPPEGCFVKSAELTFLSEESKVFDAAIVIQRGSGSVSMDEHNVCTVIHRYPPVAAEMRLRIDIRELDLVSAP